MIGRATLREHVGDHLSISGSVGVCGFGDFGSVWDMGCVGYGTRNSLNSQTI